MRPAAARLRAQAAVVVAASALGAALLAPAASAAAAAWICFGRPGAEQRRGEEEEEAAEAQEEEEEVEEEKSPKPGGEPKCIKGAVAGAGGQGRGGRAGGGSSREVWGAERRGGMTRGKRSAAAPTPARTRARTHTLSHALRTPGQEAPKGARKMKSRELRGHGARARRPCAGQADPRGENENASELRTRHRDPLCPQLHLTAAVALGRRVEAGRPLHRALGR